MEPTDPIRNQNPYPTPTQKTEEQRQVDMRLTQQTLNAKTGPYNLLPKYAGRSKTQAFSYLAAVLPAYLASRIVPYPLYHTKSMVVVGVVYVVSATLLNILITAWVRKKPPSSKWYYFLD